MGMEAFQSGKKKKKMVKTFTEIEYVCVIPLELQIKTGRTYFLVVTKNNN